MSRTPRIVVADLPPAVPLTEAEMAALLGGSLNWRARLGIESMEVRELPAAALTASLSGGVLRIEGTDRADNILIQQVGTQLSVYGVGIQSGRQAVAAVPLTAVSAVTVLGLGGDDNINTTAFGKAAGVYGGLGNDRILVGPGPSVVYGEGGNDTLLGGAGADYLSGGAGADRLSGGAGNDTLEGDAADTLLDGGAGVNRINRPPVLAAIPDQRMTAGQLSLTVPISAADPDGNRLAVTAVVRAVGGTAPATVAVSGSTLTITPRAGFVGRFVVDVTVNDGTRTDAKSFAVDVVANRAPVLAAIPPVEVRGGSAVVPLSVTDPDGNAVTFTAQVVTPTGPVPATLQVTGNQLTIRPAAGYAGTFRVRVTASDGRATHSQEFDCRVPAQPAVEVRLVAGTADTESVSLAAGGDFRLYRVTLAAGDTLTATTGQPAGAAGMDTYLRLFDATGTQLASDDDSGGGYYSRLTFAAPRAGVYFVGVSEYRNRAYTATAPRIDGDGRAGECALTLTRQTATTPVADPSYETYLRQKLVQGVGQGGFTDERGFVVKLENGQPGAQGDAVLFTGLAVADAAMRGDAAHALQYLTVLFERGWDSAGNPIRHPDVKEYVRDGRGGYRPNDVFSPAGYRPLSRDGVIGVMTGTYFAFTSAGMNDQVRSLARQVFEKYLSYLQAHNWMTIPTFPDVYRRTELKDPSKPADGEVLADLFSNPEGGRIDALGRDGFMLAPHDRFAMQSVAQAMGIGTVSATAVLVGVGASLTEMLGSEVRRYAEPVADRIADRLAGAIRDGLNGWRIELPYSLSLSPLVPAAAVTGQISLALLEPIRNEIPGLIRTAVREYLLALVTVNNADVLASAYRQLSEGIGRAVDRLVSAVPGFASQDAWRPLIVDAVQKILGGGLLTDQYTFIAKWFTFELGGELAKRKDTVAHLTFWPTLIACETDPLLRTTLAPLVSDVHGYLKQGQMRMGLYAWLAGDSGYANDRLDEIRNTPNYSNVEYAWTESASKLDEHLGGSPGVGNASHRLDYLLLKDLMARGLPSGVANRTAIDWAAHWGSAIADAWRGAVAGVTASAASIPGALVARAGRFLAGQDAIRQRIQTGIDSLRDTYDRSRRTAEDTLRRAQDALAQAEADLRNAADQAQPALENAIRQAQAARDTAVGYARSAYDAAQSRFNEVRNSIATISNQISQIGSTLATKAQQLANAANIPSIPAWQVPGISLPSVNLPNVSVPSVNLPSIAKQAISSIGGSWLVDPETILRAEVYQLEQRRNSANQQLATRQAALGGESGILATRNTAIQLADADRDRLIAVATGTRDAATAPFRAAVERARAAVASAQAALDALTAAYDREVASKAAELAAVPTADSLRNRIASLIAGRADAIRDIARSVIETTALNHPADAGAEFNGRVIALLVQDLRAAIPGVF